MQLRHSDALESVERTSLFRSPRASRKDHWVVIVSLSDTSGVFVAVSSTSEKGSRVIGSAEVRGSQHKIGWSSRSLGGQAIERIPDAIAVALPVIQGDRRCVMGN